MSSVHKNAEIFLTHILENSTVVVEKVKDVTEEQFHGSTDLQDIFIRRIEVIGEAVKHLPKDFTDKHPEIPWKKIAGMRDMLIHHYFEVDYNLLWTTVSEIIPPFKKQIESLLKELTIQ